MLRYLLDTDICIYTLNKRNELLTARFNAEASSLAISSVTLSELMFGAEKSDHRNKNLEKVEAFAARLSVLDYGKRAAAHYAEIRAALQRAGKLIGPHDMLIAAHARSESLTLVTNNEREFRRVDGLRVENWTA